MGHQGAVISPYYDSLLTKVICKDRTFKGACQKLYRALDEFRIRGVKTNIPFVKNVLNTPEFYMGQVDTSFIDNNPSLMVYDEGETTRLQRLLQYLGELAVNGSTDLTPNNKCIEYLNGVKPQIP